MGPSTNIPDSYEIPIIFEDHHRLIPKKPILGADSEYPRKLRGLLLWNIVYDTMFQIPIPIGTTTIRYADDTIIVTERISVETIQN